jgi:ribosome-interacting GTPase 1
MKITFQTPPKYLDEKMIYNVLRDYKMLNCEVLVRDENGAPTLPFLVSRLDHHHILTSIPATIDDFIDVIMKDHRKYIPW